MDKLLLNTGIKYGAIGAVMFIIVAIAAWQVDLSLFLNPLVTYALPLLIFGLAVYAQIEARKKKGGFIDFSNALVVFVIAVVVALLGQLIINYLIFNVFDPGAKLELQELIIQEALEMVEKMGKLFGMEEQMGDAMDEDMLREVMEQQDSSGKDSGSLILSFIMSSVIYTIGGLISAAIIKRNPPIQFD